MPHLTPGIDVLIVDDEPDVLHSEALALRMEGISRVATAGSGQEAARLVEEKGAVVAVLDINMPDMDGVALLEKIMECRPDTTAIMLTGREDAETAVRCMKLGAFDYIVKPVDNIRFVTAVRKAMEHGELRKESGRLGRSLLTETLQHPEAFSHIVGADPRIRDICRYIEAVAPTSVPVLITGETGVGKELFAQAVHRASRATGEFVSVNTAGIDDALLSDTLFGHRRGAFTGADRDREGLIEKARHGTLFLDEIGDLRPESQIRLLRLLQEGVYYPVGADAPRRCLARLVAATNVDLVEAQAAGSFRKDLFYRLQSHRFHVPPLRERKDDIPALALHFLEKAAAEMGKKVPAVPREFNCILQNYSFPGNVRELRGMIYDAVVRHASGVLSLASLPIGPASSPAAPNSQSDSTPRPPEGIVFPERLPTLKETEEALAEEALRRADGNKTLAARLIGVTRKTLRAKV